MEISKIKEYESVVLDKSFKKSDWNVMKAKGTDQYMDVTVIEEDGDSLKVKITAKHYVGFFPLPGKNYNLVVEPKIGDDAWMKMVRWVPGYVERLPLKGRGLEVSVVKEFHESQVESLLDLAFKTVVNGRLWEEDQYVYVPTTEHSVHFENHPERFVRAMLEGREELRIRQKGVDNPPNRVILHVIRSFQGLLFGKNAAFPRDRMIKLRRVYNDIESRLTSKVKRIRSEPQLELEFKEARNNDALPDNYKEFFKACESLTLVEGNAILKGFAFNSWNTFEKFILTVLKHFCKDYIVKKPHPVKTKNGLCKPDVVLIDKNSGDIVVVVEIKYKLASSENDFNEIYKIRDMLNKLNGKSEDEHGMKGVLVYPVDVVKKYEGKEDFAAVHFDFEGFLSDGNTYLQKFAKDVEKHVRKEGMKC